MGLFMKLAGDLPLAEKSIFRNAITAIISGYIVWRNKELFLGKPENRRLLIVRSVYGLFGVLCGIYILDHMVLSDADMIGKLTGFILIILSIFVLNEKATFQQIFLCILAFLGALFIIKPALEIKFIPYLIGILGAFLAALAYLCLRILGKSSRAESPNTIVFFFSAFSTIILLPFVIWHFVELTYIQVLYLILAGLAATLGQFGITFAYQYAAAKDISIYSYSSVLFSALFAYIVFGNIPDMWSVFGYVIIFMAGLGMFVLAKK